jgi:dUTP pyrophosphatase
MFKKINDGTLPTRATKFNACVDLYANEDVMIAAGETVLVPLGVAIDQEFLKVKFTEGVAEEDMQEAMQEYDFFMSGHYLQLLLRSSLSKELIIANGVGVIDMDYPDEIMIRLHNPITTEELETAQTDMFITVVNPVNDYVIKKGDRIAQVTLIAHRSYLFDIESEAERTGGFGSTDE